MHSRTHTQNSHTLKSNVMRSLFLHVASLQVLEQMLSFFKDLYGFSIYLRGS